jgi:tricarballylate dehydrogenase
MSSEVRCSVLVVGGGNAALCAAIAAREQGADVLLVERAARAWRGGNSKYTRNLRCVSHSYTAHEFAADLHEVTGEGADPEFTELMISESAGLPDWMELQGVRWQPALNGTLSLGRTNRFFLGGGKALINTYFTRAVELGVKVLYDCRVDRLEFDGLTCVGVVAEERGRELWIGPDSIVIASAGFEANLKWLTELLGPGAQNMMVRGARQNDGRVLQQLLDGGAAVCGNARGFHSIAVDARGPRYEGGIATRVDSIPLGIMVNRNAARFSDEGENLWPKRYATWGGLIMQQPDQVAYSIFDRKVLRRFMTTAFPPLVADTVERLAELAELDADSLRRTVDTYNAAVVRGTFDPEHLDDCRTEGLPIAKSHWAQPIDEPPFYAYPLRPGITFTYMGVRANREMRVVHNDGRTFENVFAAGEVVAGNALVRGYLAGIGMTIGTVSGRLAGVGSARA